MPELPEVEATRRHLEPLVVGRRIVAAAVTHQRMLRRQERPDDFTARVAGRAIERTGRHGKHLFIELEGDITVVIHLGMSGRISVAETGTPIPGHTHVVLRLSDGNEVRFTDPRTFGYVLALLPEERRSASFSGHGPDALTGGLNGDVLCERLAGRSAPIKSLLLDQGIVSGLGNIYADEALHRAGISPLRPGGTLSPVECARLCAAIEGTLAAGLEAGGTTLDDLAYLLPDGRAGEFASRLLVYGRGGEPCPTCGTSIRRTTLRARSTHWCPECQS